MANPMKGEARLGEYTVAFNFGSFCELEERTGKKMPALLQMIQEGLGFSELRDFVWAGLQVNHPETTEDVVLKLLDEEGFTSAADAVGKAVTAFFGSQKEKAKKPSKGGVTWDWDELLEVWCEEFSPDTFLQQTARTFLAACRGRMNTRKRNAERDLILAYNTGAFSRAAKVKPLSYYLDQLQRDNRPSTASRAFHYFSSLKAKGVAVSIKRVSRDSSVSASSGAC